jgi:hypothetical protein
VASVAPAPVWAEAESEGEGSGAPGPPPIGFEEPAELSGGEETALGEAALESGEEIEEEEVVVPEEVGAEAAPPPPVPEAPPPGEEAGPPSPEETPPAVTTAPTPTPSYEAESAEPVYEAAAEPVTPEAVVRNEALVEPEAEALPSPTRHRRTAAGDAGASPPAAEPGTSPIEPEPVPVESTPAVTAVRPQSLAGDGRHVVRPGECLWTIAEGVLPAGASEARIAAEVHRLWRLNAARIGTGDPSLILVGTELRLR